MGKYRAVSVALLVVFFLLPSASFALSTPTIASISHSGTASLLYTIVGSGFQTGAKVTIGTNTTPIPSWQGGSQFIVFQPPLGSGGLVKVTNPDGSSVTKVLTIASAPVLPVIKGVAASANSSILTVWGSNFDPQATLTVNGTPITSLRRVGTQYIVFTAPAGSSGSLTVTVTNPSPTGGPTTWTGAATINAAVAAATASGAGGATGSNTTTTAPAAHSHFLSAKEKAEVDTVLLLAPLSPKIRTILQTVQFTNYISASQKNDLDRALDLINPFSSRSTGSGSGNTGTGTGTTYAYETPTTYAYQTPAVSNGPSSGTGTIFGGGWTWMGGSQGTYTGGVYGTRGVAAPGNFPGARNQSISWTGTDGNLWLFGGFGMGASGAAGLDDVWKYDVGSKLWTWMYGSTGGNVAPNYGTRGVPSPSNMPGSRANEVKWKDSSGAIWIFGGVAGSDDEFSWRNDLWKFDPSSGTWTWMSGTPNVKSGGVCGTRGVPSVNNVPGGRVLATSWIDSSDNLWLMGGWAYDCGGNQMIGNDLWKYSPSTNQWAWMGGSSTDAVSGSQGVPSSNNIPAARQQGMAWTDPAGNFWLFGGFGHNGSFAYPVNGYGAYSDFWRYQPSSGQWTWMGGSQTGDAAGNYGTLGTPSPSNMPGARRSGGAVVDNQGNLWLFGGMGAHDSGGNTGGLNDLWKYQPSTGVWTWVSGSNGLNAPSTFGTQGVAGSGNAPGLRTSASYWADGNGQIWVFGGEPFASSHSGILNDLWVFNPNASVVSNPSPTPTPVPTQPTTNSNFSGLPAKVIFRFPAADAQWNEFIQTAPRGSIVFPQYIADGHDAIVTTDLQPSPGLAAHVQQAANAGMRVLGYVNAKSNNVVKSDDLAKSEIDVWFKMPGIGGIYFGAGGALDQASINHFNMLADYIHSRYGGIAVMHGDEGGSTDQQLVSHFDILVTSESYTHYDSNGVLMNDFFSVPVFSNATRAFMANYPRSKFAAFANPTPLYNNDIQNLKKMECDYLGYGDGYLFLSNVDGLTAVDDPTYWQTFINGLGGAGCGG